VLITHSGYRQDPDRRCRRQQTDRSPRYRLGRVGNAATERVLFQPDRGKPAVRLIGGGVEPWSGSLTVTWSARHPATRPAADGAVGASGVTMPFTITTVRVLAHFLVLGGVVGWKGAAQVGVWVWIGFPAMIFLSSIVWKNFPLELAAIHGGDWLQKLLLMAIMLSVWRPDKKLS
jgi:hypothetical protein